MPKTAHDQRHVIANDFFYIYILHHQDIGPKLQKEEKRKKGENKKLIYWTKFAAPLNFQDDFDIFPLYKYTLHLYKSRDFNFCHFLHLVFSK